MTYQPELATDYYGQNIKGWLFSEKFDGIRAYWTGTELLTRTGKHIDCPNWVTAGLPRFPIEGELWAGRAQFQKVLSALRSGQDGDWSDIKLMAFDAPQAGVAFADRVKTLEALSFVNIVKQIAVSGKREMKRLVREIIANGGEGGVLRNPASLHVAGKSDDYARVKPVLCAEATVLGHVGTTTGKTSLLCEYNGESFRLHTSQAKQISAGASVTFSYYGLTDAGKPRQPQFVAVRDYE